MDDDQYSSWTGLLYVFNLIVGTGALTLPKAFSQAGWLFSSILIVFLAFVSYVAVTFVIESMSTCNAIIQWTKVEKMKKVSRYIRSAIQADSAEDEVDSEDAMLLPSEYIENFPSEPYRFFTIDRKIELSEMSAVVFNKIGQTIFYICLSLYLFGDMTIYAAAVGKSLVDVTCQSNSSVNYTDWDNCWETVALPRRNVYRIYLALFFVLFGPYAFFNVQKTKYLQFITVIMRWTAFAVMISLTIRRLSSDVPHGEPSTVVTAGLPALLGSCVYSFMCHHSLPGMLSPMADKSKLYGYLALDYLIILIFYLTLAVTAVFAFPYLEDLYTLNFTPQQGAPILLEIINYFLTLFPVFTLTATFPIIAVTLRSNFQAMFVRVESWWLHRIVIPFFTVLPPILIAMLTEDIEILVGITGSYAGVAIQYIIPALLVILSRNSIPEPLLRLPNRHESPFKSQFWPFFVLVWSTVCLVLVTFDLLKNKIMAI